MLILIVDDNPSNLEVLSLALAGRGHEVAVATSGEQALEQIVRERPALILLDIRLPGIDGFETCRRLQADPATRGIPVIFMTAVTDTVEKVRGLELGAVDYITKPFEEKEVLARINVHLKLEMLTRTLAEQNAALSREVSERAAAEEALSALTRDLEARVQRMTESLRRSHDALEQEVALRTEELRQANHRLEEELVLHKRTETARAALQTEIIAVQNRMLSERATPLMPITDWLMVMPLVGTMDAGRAQQVLEALLLGVQQHRASVVIIDVTGIKTVDADVAASLVRSASALRLLGAQAVITGVRPEVAQTFVQLGVDLGQTVTRGTLQSGIAYALEHSGQLADRAMFSARAAAAPGQVQRP